MRPDLAIGFGQTGMLSIALLAALFVPRAGEPAALVPLGSQRLGHAFAFAQSENAQPVAIDTATGRLIIAAPPADGLLRALANGFVPITAASAGCTDLIDRKQ